jgi:hypothetical protein
VNTNAAIAPEDLVSNADYVQLSRLVIEHAWRTDHAQSHTLHELWVDEGELDLGSTVLRGRDAIRAWGRELDEHPPWKTIRHVCGNMRFVNRGPDAAEGTTVLIVFMDADGTEPAVPFNVGEDHDRFVRTERGWRLLSRRWIELFARGDALELP